MGNRCREGNLGKNNLPQSLNDHTHNRLCHRGFQDCLFVFIYMWMCVWNKQYLLHCVHCYSLMTHLIHLVFFSPNILCSLCPSSFETILRNFINRSEGITEAICGHAVLSLLLAFISVNIRQERCPQHLVCNFRKSCAVQNTLSILFRRDEAVYYYSTEVISDAMCPHAKNNAQNMPRITHGHFSAPCMCAPPALGKWVQSPRLQALTSHFAVNVRTCLCLCNCLMCTPMPCVVCINCGWIGLKGQFIETRGGCQEQTREWKEWNQSQVLTDCEETFEKGNSDVINIVKLYFCRFGQSSSWSVFIVMKYDCTDIKWVSLF